MTMIGTPDEPYRRADYDNEADLEKAILQVQTDLWRCAGTRSAPG